MQTPRQISKKINKPKQQEVIVSRKTIHSLLECFALHEHFVFMIINPRTVKCLNTVFVIDSGTKYSND